MKHLNPVTKALSIIALCLIFFAACKKTDDLIEPIKPPIEIPPIANDAVKVAATVTGSVLDENNAPVPNAVVTAGTATTNTDAMGNFSFRNISISAANGSVTVVKAGYFKGIRNFVTEASRNNYVKIQLIKQTLTGTITSASGGSVTTNNATITFPANAFVTAAGTPYSGNVKVYAAWIDPTAANLPLVVPGDLRGLNSTNGEYLLKSYGMVGAELKDDNGNTVKIASGKTAGISFPIPNSLDATAPATIPLWHFDEVTNRWREEGTATKNGSTYTAQVNKFSFWNVDVPANFVYLDMRLVNNATNLPLANTLVKITSLSTNTSAYDFTNDDGYVGGYVPKNESLKLEIIAGCNINTVIYTQNLGPYNTITNLGNINATLPASQVISFTGTVKGCNNLPVSNGYISLSLANGTSAIAYTNASGVVNFSLPYCGGNTTYSYNAIDFTNGSYSNTATGTTTGNTVNLGTITACGNTINVNGVYIAGFIDGRAVIWKDGVPTFLTGLPVGNKLAWTNSVIVYNNDVYALGGEEDSTIINGYTKTIKLWKNGVVTDIASGSSNPDGNGFDIYNGDVYICSEESIGNNTINKVWKNGVATTLSNGIFNRTEAINIKVSNGDVYVNGVGYNNLNESTAMYWKNGVINVLPNLISNSRTSNLFINNGDLYFSGEDNNTAVFWKNGIKTVLNISTPYSYGYSKSIFVDNNDVYVVGKISFSSITPTVNYSNAIYWKNNNPNILTSNNTNGSSSSLSNIFVKSNIVYTTGGTGNMFAPLYFQNNVPVPLQGITNAREVYSRGIFVQ
jgi:Carboxypeptidase regulatory-like domain